MSLREAQILLLAEFEERRQEILRNHMYLLHPDKSSDDANVVFTTGTKVLLELNR